MSRRHLAVPTGEPHSRRIYFIFLHLLGCQAALHQALDSRRHGPPAGSYSAATQERKRPLGRVWRLTPHSVSSFATPPAHAFHSNATGGVIVPPTSALPT
ncbi:hypothetical protein BDP55DRAFT_50093 [Colletotrichum godetiae]|uniref:Uncharacterized protein n=1 Tax=Colletotrichum godetiae TaxID=1209918 RepID=A0AAJ0AQP2_9PEZI|nr:uncharacterized protein BDP55DRAFT_50093 [Colletotrichum godetiae]KAK1688612.1 hypothetical protein BDP55DRAFT_50093 [Colletotrichum godetiae]